MGCDPTIGGPAQVATWAGPFLTERSQCNDSRSYKGGLGAQRRNPPSDSQLVSWPVGYAPPALTQPTVSCPLLRRGFAAY